MPTYRASPRVGHLYLSSIFFLANQEKIASNSLASNLTNLETWQISPPPRANIRALGDLASASLRRNGAREGRSPSFSRACARRSPSPSLLEFRYVSCSSFRPLHAKSTGGNVVAGLSSSICCCVLLDSKEKLYLPYGNLILPSPARRARRQQW